MNKQPKVSIVIPNWNGERLLKKNLPDVLESKPDELIVVDDGSTDGSGQVLRQFKEVKTIVHQKNLGFVSSVDDGVKAAKGDIIVLFNNDVSPKKDFLVPLISHFEKADVFAVSCAEKGYSWAWAEFENGFITHGMGKPTKNTHPSFWASGGSAAFSKEKWQILGGMDPMYYPFYWEDIDFSYRAQKRGWKIIWEPKSVVKHNHESTIAKHFSRSYMDYISQRNQLLFIWKNISSRKLISKHRQALISKLISGQFWRPFLGALPKLDYALKKRQQEQTETKVDDEGIFSQFANY